jgi:hypothetical protein
LRPPFFRRWCFAVVVWILAHRAFAAVGSAGSEAAVGIAARGTQSCNGSTDSAAGNAGVWNFTGDNLFLIFEFIRWVRQGPRDGWLIDVDAAVFFVHGSLVRRTMARASSAARSASARMNLAVGGFRRGAGRNFLVPRVRKLERLDWCFFVALLFFAGHWRSPWVSSRFVTRIRKCCAPVY